MQGSSDRAFGLVFGTVFGVIALLPLVSGGPARIWSLVVAGAFLVIALAAPKLLAPLNRIWLRFGLLLHRVTSPIVLGVMFFLIIVPVGLVMRLFGRDPLRLRFDRRAPTYWIDRDPPGPPPDSFGNQF